MSSAVTAPGPLGHRPLASLASAAGAPGKVVRRQRGSLTFFEAMGSYVMGLVVLALAAGALYAGWALLNRGQGQSEAQQIVGNVRQWLGTGNVNYTGLDNATALTAEVFPDSMKKDAGNVVLNPWGGNVTLAAVSQTQFTLTYTGVPAADCAKLVTAMAGDQASGLLGLSINGAAQVIPVNGATVTAACNAGNSNTIVWTLR